MKIVKAMYLENAEVKMPEGKTPFDCAFGKVLIVLLAIPNIVLCFYWEPVLKLARNAIQFFTGV